MRSSQTGLTVVLIVQSTGQAGYTDTIKYSLVNDKKKKRSKELHVTL